MPPLVDRLVKIADHGEIHAAKSQVAHDFVLRKLSVLNLIDLNEVKSLCPAFGNLWLRMKGLPGEVYEVSEVNRVTCPEGCVVPLGEGLIL